MVHTVLSTENVFPDIASLLLRIVLGVFFVLARFRWFFDPSRPDQPLFNTLRRIHLTAKLCECGYGKHPLLAGVVACVEVFGGLSVIGGFLTRFATTGLLTVLLFATLCTAMQKVCEQRPVDGVDCVSCYLWRVEGVYITIALCILALGPGVYSLDWLLW
jgi:uncharacterized membrane protein YphA (DoxX/SURF4 family)